MSARLHRIVKHLTGLVRGIQSLRVACFTSQESSQEAWMMGEFAMHQFVLKLVEIELVWVVTKKSF